MKTNTATALRLETTMTAPTADMLSGTSTTLMSSIAQDKVTARADMLSGAKTCMMSSIADL